ncbi:MAG: hypothetical protein ACREQZ_07135 [Woeseiaceae bacterium]
MHGIQGKMYKGAKVFLLALALLVGLAPAAPALALAAHDATAVSDCCAPPPSCDAPGAGCVVQQVCQPGFPSAADQAQTPLFAAVADEPRHAPRLPSPPTLAASFVDAPRAGPPLYLRFQHFLL